MVRFQRAPGCSPKGSNKRVQEWCDFSVPPGAPRKGATKEIRNGALSACARMLPERE